MNTILAVSCQLAILCAYCKLDVFATTPEPQFRLKSQYTIVKIAEADKNGNEKWTDCGVVEGKAIFFNVYVGLDENNDETERRRFIIEGGVENKQFVVFERNEFNIIQGQGSNRFVLAITHPNSTVPFVYYGIMLNLDDDLHKNFGTEIPAYASSDINVPGVLHSFADFL